MTVGIDPARIDPAIDLHTLFGEESTGRSIFFGSGEVDLAVSGVEVTHDEHPRAAAAQALESLEQPAVEVELVGHSAVVAIFAIPVGKVDVGDREPPEARDLDSPLGVETSLVERGVDPVGSASRVEADAAVALALRGEETRATF